MEMEGSGASQIQLIHPAVDFDEAALAVIKRERKRSRYLSPPYTDTGVQEKRASGSRKQQREEEEEEGPHVSASEVLSALRAAALGQGEGMDAAALRFLALYGRNRNSIFVDDGGDKPPSAAGVGRKMLDLDAGLDDGSLAKKKKKKKKKNPNPKNPHPPPAVAVAVAVATTGANVNARQQKDDGTMKIAAAPELAIVAHGASLNPLPVVTTATTPININIEKKRKTYKRRAIKTAGQNPVALVLDFAEGTSLPSREDLLSTFSRFGSVIDSKTTISQDRHTAQVAFTTRVQAEAALSCAATPGGAFGPPFVVASLQDLPPVTLNAPPRPLPKLPLTDIRNNLGKMILSLSSKAVVAPQAANAKTAVDSLSLVGEMQRLLAKVDEVLQVQGASAAHHP